MRRLIQFALLCLLVTPAWATTYHLATAAGGGSDSNNGLTTGAPWLTPNHAVDCGDVIIAAASSAYLEANFSWSSWGKVTCPAGNNVVWLKCATFDRCKMSVPSDAPPYSGGFNVDMDYWGVQGWEVDSANADGPCFQASPGGGSISVHHIIFANDIAVGCGQGGFTSGPNGLLGVDYWAVIGSIAYNTAQSSAECYSGIDAFGPVASDSLPGTHIYFAGNFTWGNVAPNPCGRGRPTDGQGLFFDTPQSIDNNPYRQQMVMDNNISIFNGGNGAKIYDNSTGTPNAKTYIRHTTTYDNETGNIEGVSCAEVALQASHSSEVFGNLSEASAAGTCYGAGKIFLLLTTSPDSTDHFYNNFGYSAAGYNTSGTGTGFSFGPSNTFGANPNFANPVAPGAPSCGSYSSVPACMATVIANFTPTNTAAKGYGYQIPSSTSVYDPLFPQWLCNVDLPPGLISMGCKTEP